MEKLFTISDSYNLTQLSSPPFYPERAVLPDDQTDWDVHAEDYSPADFTAEFVYENEGVWADASLEREGIEARELLDVQIEYDEEGRPLNPYGRTGLRGRGALGRYGANPCGGAIIMSDDEQEIVVVERKSGHIGLPGGFMNPGETAEQAAIREVQEETQIELGGHVLRRVLREEGGLFVPAGITTDNAWIEWDAFFAKVAKEDVEIVPDLDELADARWMSVREAGASLMPVFQHFLSQVFETADY